MARARLEGHVHARPHLLLGEGHAGAALEPRESDPEAELSASTPSESLFILFDFIFILFDLISGCEDQQRLRAAGRSPRAPSWQAVMASLGEPWSCYVSRLVRALQTQPQRAKAQGLTLSRR